MSQSALISGTILGRRYVVKSAASFDTRRRAYLVRDTDDPARPPLVAEEILLSGLDSADRELRRGLFLDALARATSFDHARLCPIYESITQGNRAFLVMPRIDGVPLSAILEMGSHGVREASAIRWACQIAEAMAWLHAQSPPYLLDALDPDYVVITPRDDVILVGYGLQRFFGTARPRSASAAGADDLRRDQAVLGRLLLRLLVGQHGEREAALAAASDAVHAPTVEIVRRLLDGAFRDMDEVCEALAAVRGEEPTPATHAPVRVATGDRVRGDARLLRSAAALLLVAVIGTMVWMLRLLPSTGAPVPARFWVLTGEDEISPVTLEGGVQAGSVRVPGTRLVDVRFAAAADTLVLADLALPGLLFVHDARRSECPLKSPPRHILLHPDGRHAICFEGDDAVVEASIVDARRLRSWKLGGRLSAMTLGSGGRLLYVSDTQASVIHTIDLHRGQVLGSTPVAHGPGPLVADLGGRALWTATQDTGRIALLALRDDGQPVRTPIALDPPLHDYVAALHFTSDGRFLYALCRDSHRIAVFNVRTRALVRQVDTVAWQPRAWTFVERPPTAYVISDGSAEVAVIDTRSHEYVGSVTLRVRPLAIDYAPP